jgi:hypothetical protein
MRLNWSRLRSTSARERGSATFSSTLRSANDLLIAIRLSLHFRQANEFATRAVRRVSLAPAN